jgi:hypothetical protein
MKRRPLSARSSRKIFRKGSKVNRKNALAGVGMAGIMRGGIRF